VQLYVRDEVASVSRPVKELKGFARVELEPGQTIQVDFTMGAEDLQFWGVDGTWTVEPGFFTVYVGSSSEDVISDRIELIN
jgi:beta-glucosidase